MRSLEGDFFEDRHAVMTSHADDLAVLRTGQSVVRKLAHRVLPDGSEVAWEVTRVAIRNIHRDVVGVIGNAVPVSEKPALHPPVLADAYMPPSIEIT